MERMRTERVDLLQVRHSSVPILSVCHSYFVKVPLGRLHGQGISYCSYPLIGPKKSRCNSSHRIMQLRHNQNWRNMYRTWPWCNCVKPSSGIHSLLVFLGFDLIVRVVLVNWHQTSTWNVWRVWETRPQVADIWNVGTWAARILMLFNRSMIS